MAGYSDHRLGHAAAGRFVGDVARMVRAVGGPGYGSIYQGGDRLGQFDTLGRFGRFGRRLAGQGRLGRRNIERRQGREVGYDLERRSRTSPSIPSSHRTRPIPARPRRAGPVVSAT